MKANATSRLAELLTVDEARRLIDDGLEICPACRQVCKRYRRWLRPEWLALLARMVKDHGQEWVSIYDQYGWAVAGKSGNDWQRMRSFGLIETKGYEGRDKTHSGIWRVTDLGMLFRHGVDSIPSYNYVRFNKVVGESEDFVTFNDVMRWKWGFDLRKIYDLDEAEMTAMQWNTCKKPRAASGKKS